MYPSSRGRMRTGAVSSRTSPQQQQRYPMPQKKDPEIVLTVTKFRDVLNTKVKDRGTHHTMHVEPDDHPIIFMKKSEPTREQQSSGDSGVLHIKKQGRMLRFRIESQEEDDAKSVYHPIGIAFQRRNGNGKGKRTGRHTFDFKTLRLDGKRLEIRDNFSEPCSCDKDYKFSVIIQREHDAVIGIIDPGIQNEK